ncbi:hypothetical protein B296_00051089 [Ensete ventricosum]|uniref:Uncharacterized protein n=1 Tax=Ensete ventricosum TaxID=4639 RepID=A0A426X622_ENSVE|nr:hypothetical protein B296_00051089 [Ensete ventricosum]
MVRATGEWDCSYAYIRLREPDKSKDKAEGGSTNREGTQIQGNDRTIGLATPWYRKGDTSVESSIPCSYGGRALVVKGAEEVENVEENSKYQDKAEGQKPENFIRPVSTGFSSR